MSGALSHFLQHAATTHLPGFDRWFPGVFDWRSLCADVPEMVRRRAEAAAADATGDDDTGDGDAGDEETGDEETGDEETGDEETGEGALGRPLARDPTLLEEADREELAADVLGPDLTDDDELADVAGSVFRAAHLFALAILCASAESESDPEGLLERLATAPGDEEESALEDLVGTCLEEVERRVVGQHPTRRLRGEYRDQVLRTSALVEGVWPALAQVLADDEARVFERARSGAPVLWGVARVATILAAFRWLAAERWQAAWPVLDLDPEAGLEPDPDGDPDRDRDRDP